MTDGMRYVVMTGIGVPAAGVVFYGVRVAIERWKARGELQDKEESAPLDLATKMMDRAFEEARQAREQTRVIIENHLEHDRQDRERASNSNRELIEVMTEFKEAMRTIVDEQRGQREDHRANASKTFDKIEAMHKDVLRAQGGA